MLNINKLLKFTGITIGILGTSWLVADWCEYCQQHHRGNRCPAETINAVNHPHAYNCGYGCENAYEQGRRQGYNEAYRSFNCLQWFNQMELEGWDSDDEEEYVRQAEERARELRRRRTQHHVLSEFHRRQQAINNIYQMNSQEDLLAILNALQNRVQDLGFQIRDNQIIRPELDPCGGYDPYDCN